MVVVWAHSPVFGMIVLVRVVFLVVGEEVVKLDGLFEVLHGLHASDVLQEIEVSVDVDSCSDQSVPVHGLELNIGVILLELEIDGLSKVNVWSLDSVHVFSSHLKLIEVKVLGEHFHFCIN